MFVLMVQLVGGPIGSPHFWLTRDFSAYFWHRHPPTAHRRPLAAAATLRAHSRPWCAHYRVRAHTSRVACSLLAKSPLLPERASERAPRTVERRGERSERGLHSGTVELWKLRMCSGKRVFSFWRERDGQCVPALHRIALSSCRRGVGGGWWLWLWLQLERPAPFRAFREIWPKCFPRQPCYFFGPRICQLLISTHGRKNGKTKGGGWPWVGGVAEGWPPSVSHLWSNLEIP